MRNRPYLLFVLVLCGYQAFAQAPDSTAASVQGSERAGTLPKGDTLAMYAYPALQPWDTASFTGPTLSDMRFYDPATPRQGMPHARLSNLGTAAFPLIPTAPAPIGFQAGFHHFAPYRLDADSLRFVSPRSAFTDLYYSQGPTSEDGLFRGAFARRFGKGTDLTIETLRIYNQGDYARLANHHSSLRLGMRYALPGGRYAITALHGNHLFEQPENGGIRTDTLLGDAFYLDRANVPVQLNQAETRHRETDYQLAQAYALKGDVDSRDAGSLLIQHRLRWQDRRYRFSDTKPDSSFYGPLFTEPRGLRQFTRWTTLSNLLEAHAGWNSPSGKLHLQGGLEHRYHRWDNELEEGRLQNLLAVGGADIRWKDRIDLRADLQADLGDQAGSFRFSAQAGLDLGRRASLQGGIVMGRRYPELLEERLAVAQRAVYRQDLRPVFEQSVWGRIRIPALRLEGGADLQLFRDPVLWTTYGIPEQRNVTALRSRIWLAHALRVGKFHLEQRLHWQRNADALMAIPEWISTHDLYYEGLWFKKTLRTRIGTAVRVVSPWTPNGYMPLHGVFVRQDVREEPWFPQLDGYVAAERLGFRFFLAMENVGQSIFGWTSTAGNGKEIPRVFRLVDGYPMPENWLRLGVAFTFRG